MPPWLTVLFLPSVRSANGARCPGPSRWAATGSSQQAQPTRISVSAPADSGAGEISAQPLLIHPLLIPFLLIPDRKSKDGQRTTADRLNTAPTHFNSQEGTKDYTPSFNQKQGGKTMSNTEITATVTQLQELRRMQEELTAEIEALTDAIKAHMGTQELLLAGPYKITWKPVTSSRIDTTALKKALPDIAAKYTKTTTTRRFEIR